MKNIVKWIKDEKGTMYLLDNVLTYYSVFREQEHKTLDKDEIVEIELVKTDTVYKFKNIVQVKEIKNLFFI